MNEIDQFLEEYCRTEVRSIIEAKKYIHQGRLHGHISGGGIIKLSDRYYLEFIPKGDQFVEVKVLNCGEGSYVETKSYVRNAPKKPKVKKEVSKGQTTVEETI